MVSPIEKAKRISSNLPIISFELDKTFSSSKGISKQKKEGQEKSFGTTKTIILVIQQGILIGKSQLNKVIF